MILSNEALHSTLVKIICEDWNEKEKVAKMFVDQLFAAAKEGGSVADITNMFKKHYIAASPVDEAEMWKYMFNIKALHAWAGEDIEAKLTRLEDESVCNWVMLDADAVEGSREKTRVEMLGLEEQAAIYHETEKNRGCISPYFYENLVRVYPNLVEAYLFYLDFALPRRQFDGARKALNKLEESYPCDFRLLKRRLDLCQSDGSLEEVYAAAGKAIEFLDTNRNKPGFDLAHYAGQVQLSAKDYNGAVETYGYLMTNWNYMDPTNPVELRSLLSLFFDVCRIPGPYVVDQIMLMTVQYSFILRAILKAGVDMDDRENASMVGNTVVQMSSQLSYPHMRIPFKTLLEFLQEVGLLAKDGFERIIETGYQAIESYGIGEDSSMRDDIRDALLMLYNGPDKLTADQMENLYLYFGMSVARKNHLKKNYPIINGMLDAALKGYKKQSEKAAKNPFASQATAPIMRSAKKVGRNDPCPCGSGKKYKQCCGR